MAKRVLVADDSATIQRAFAMVFGGQDVSIVPARSLDEAISAARQGRPDLVIADAGLGNRTGYDLAAAVKADPGLRSVPVYILASSHNAFDEARARETGVDGHLLKPFESQALIDKVNEVLSRPAAAPAAARVESPAVAAASFGARPMTARPAPATPSAADEDDYGEFTIERSSGASPAPAGVRPAASAAPAAAPSRPSPIGAPTPAPLPTGLGNPPGGLRPSLIPGARPGAVPARPPMVPPAPTPLRPAAPAAFSGAAPMGQASAGRTIMGLPAVAIPAPGGARPSAPGPSSSPGSVPPPAGARPFPAPLPAPTPAPLPFPSSLPSHAPAVPSPSAHLPSAPSPFAPSLAPPASIAPPPSIAPAHSPPAAAPFGPPSSDLAASFSARIEQKVAAVAARGPEYEAIAKLSREVIEQVVWEVVPELAEAIIREHVERLASARK